MTRCTGAACAALLLAAAGASPAQMTGVPLDLATYPQAALTIVHRDGGQDAHRYQFEVWVADTGQRAEQGLMFVHDLPPSRGMVFPLTPPRVESMWMKNTYIALDMLFIDADGRVTKIIEQAKPLSLDILSSDAPVAAVLELKAGEVHRLGLSLGDSVSWKPATAALP